MSGPILGGAPWTRDAITQFKATYPEYASAIEQSIPDDYHILITAGYRPGQWGAKLVHDHGLTAASVSPAGTISSVCWAVLEKARAAA